MKTFSEHTNPKLEDIRLDIPSHSLFEASIMKPDYVVGQKFVFNGNWKELAGYGYTKNDVFEIVKPVSNPHAELASKTASDTALTKHLEGPDGKVFSITGSLGYQSGSFTHLKAAGSPPTGAQWEELIIFAYNEINKKPTEESVVETAMFFHAQYGDQAKVIAKNFMKELSAKQLVSTGKGGIPNAIGKIYTESGASNKTPKTDIASATFKEKISLKKGGGSQLASGAKGESIAIVRSALSEMGAEKGFATGLTNAMENQMSALITKETITSLNKRVKDGESDDAIIDFQKKDKDNRELSAMLGSYINQDTKANQLFSQYVVFEAATGNRKFDKGPAAANLLGKFDIGGKVQVESMASVNDKIIKQMSREVLPSIAFKKGGGSGSAYSSMRLGLAEDFRGIVLSELNSMEEFSNLLTEDFLEEGPMDMIKRAGKWSKDFGSKVWNKFQKIIANILKKLSAAFSKIAKMGNRMFDALLGFLGLQIDTVKGIPVEIELK